MVADIAGINVDIDTSNKKTIKNNDIYKIYEIGQKFYLIVFLASLLNSYNYDDYTVTKTGVGATGTWNIDISGNANTASRLETSRTI